MWKQIPNEEYHSEYRNYLSSSDLRRLLRSPAHYRAPAAPSTPAQEFGTLAHECVLEPDVWKASSRPSPKIDRRTKEGKALAEWQQAQEAQHGIKYVSEDLYYQVEALAGSVHSSVGSSGFLTSGVAELSGFTTINDTNIRVRPDYLKDDVIVDLKTTTSDARMESFTRSVFAFGYDVQAALYVDAAKAIDGKQRRFVWIVVEKEAPYGVCIYEASQEVLARGRKLYNQAIETYAQCSAFDVWPTYSTAIQTFNIPRYLEIL